MVTKDVAAGATMVGIPARPVPVDAVHYSPGFVPYGTPCGEDVDPAARRLAELEAGDRRAAPRESPSSKARRQPAPKAKSA